MYVLSAGAVKMNAFPSVYSSDPPLSLHLNVFSLTLQAGS